jgi:hypothetical protein
MKSSLVTFLLCLSLVAGQSVSCSCRLEGTGMTMICENVQSLIGYQQCMHEQLTLQSDLKLRRGGVITNLTIRHHQLRSLSNGLLQFSYANILYQLSDLRYLHLVHGTLKQIDAKALALVEQALEHLDLSDNELQQMPNIADENEQKPSNLMYGFISNQRRISIFFSL